MKNKMGGACSKHEGNLQGIDYFKDLGVDAKVDLLKLGVMIFSGFIWLVIGTHWQVF
jgi:hypothetical protein